jgi:hypothetical protein
VILLLAGKDCSVQALVSATLVQNWQGIAILRNSGIVSMNHDLVCPKQSGIAMWCASSNKGSRFGAPPSTLRQS